MVTGAQGQRSMVMAFLFFLIKNDYKFCFKSELSPSTDSTEFYVLQVQLILLTQTLFLMVLSHMFHVTYT